jgi:hypothetical protein
MTVRLVSVTDRREQQPLLWMVGADMRCSFLSKSFRNGNRALLLIFRHPLTLLLGADIDHARSRSMSWAVMYITSCSRQQLPRKNSKRRRSAFVRVPRMGAKALVRRSPPPIFDDIAEEQILAIALSLVRFGAPGHRPRSVTREGEIDARPQFIGSLRVESDIALDCAITNAE